MIDLAPEHLELLVNTLKAHLHKDAKAYIFGSRVKSTARKFSDIDLLIKTTSPLSTSVKVQLQDAFEESDLPMRVDISEWQHLSEAFKRQIWKECVKVFDTAESDCA